MILAMERVRLLGPRDLLDHALVFLQSQGVLEIRAPSSDGPVRPKELSSALAAEELRLEDHRARAQALRARLPEVAGPPAAGPALPPVGSPELGDWLKGLEEEVETFASRRAALLEEREGAERFARLVVALAPLHHRVDASLDPELHGLVLRYDPEALALLTGEVRRLAGEDCEVESRSIDEGHVGVLVVVPRSKSRALQSLLFERGVEEVKLPASCLGHGVFEVLLRVVERLQHIPEELSKVDARLAAIALSAVALLDRAAVDSAAALDRDHTAEHCGETRFTFVVSGYMPAERVQSLRTNAAAEFGDRVVVFDDPPTREDWEEVPVVLRNPLLVRPFEHLLALMPLPRYGTIDPTPYLAVFFPLFFGLVLGDVVFGILGITTAAILLVRRVGGALGRDLAQVALWCSVSALVFGLVFGEALGELGARWVGLPSGVFDRRHAVMGFLGVAVAVGAVHVLVGMALGVSSSVHSGHAREAIDRAARLLIVVALAIAGGASMRWLPRMLEMPGFALAGLALVVAIAAGGPMAALDVVLGMGNILSYARLMALGLASVLLAEVANLLGSVLKPAAVGISLAILLHAVNYTLCIISPIIASLRLHYVEFFEKFYDAGGLPYRPFTRTA